MLEQPNRGAIYNMEGFGSDGARQLGMALYGSTKTALRYFTKSLADETRESGVIIGTTSPGIVVTELLTSVYAKGDPELWKQTGGNPRLLLRCVSQEALDHAGGDPAYLGRYQQALTAFDAYISAPQPSADAPLVAYFCAEYGFHESFPIYSGGLGVLAGDHCKAASDERMNFVAVGLLYGQGYFTQSVDNDGLQHAAYQEHDPRDLLGMLRRVPEDHLASQAGAHEVVGGTLDEFVEVDCQPVGQVVDGHFPARLDLAVEGIAVVDEDLGDLHVEMPRGWPQSLADQWKQVAPPSPLPPAGTEYPVIQRR